MTRLFVFKGVKEREVVVSEGVVTVEEGIRLYFRKVGDGPKVVFIPNGLYMLDEFKRFAQGRALIFYDVRNRGLSDPVTDSAKLAGGIHQDVEDLETLRRHFEVQEADLIGHSYIGLMVALYATKYPAHVGRLLQIGPSQPDSAKQYPAHLSGDDTTRAAVFSRIVQLQNEKRPDDPVEACRKFWSVLQELYVANPANAARIDWGRCDLPNERNFMKYFTEQLAPSIQNVHLTVEQLAGVKSPVLIVHGTMDRSAPYGGARDWALLWPNARLLTVENAAHAPWIEAPELVLAAIGDFLDGGWPQQAEEVQTFERM